MPGHHIDGADSTEERCPVEPVSLVFLRLAFSFGEHVEDAGLFDDEGNFAHLPPPTDADVEEVLRRSIRGVARRLGSELLDDNDSEEPTALGMLDGRISEMNEVFRPDSFYVFELRSFQRNRWSTREKGNVL
jgi:hypothetical protein